MSESEINKQNEKPTKPKLAIVALLMSMIISVTWLLQFFLVSVNAPVIWVTKVVLILTCSLPIAIIIGIVSLIKRRGSSHSFSGHLLTIAGVATPTVLLMLAFGVFLMGKQHRKEQLRKSFATDLENVALEGDLAKVKRIVAQMPQLLQSRYDIPPLHWAALNGHEDIIRFLLAEGTDVNTRDYTGESALHKTAGSNRERAAEILITNGAMVEAKDRFGRTPLHFSAFHDFRGLTKILIANKANVNVRDNEGRTALHYAAGGGHEDMVVLLCSYGADAKAEDEYGEIPLYYATKNGHIEVGKVLRKYCDTNKHKE